MAVRSPCPLVAPANSRQVRMLPPRESFVDRNTVRCFELPCIWARQLPGVGRDPPLSERAPRDLSFPRPLPLRLVYSEFSGILLPAACRPTMSARSICSRSSVGSRKPFRDPVTKGGLWPALEWVGFCAPFYFASQKERFYSGDTVEEPAITMARIAPHERADAIVCAPLPRSPDSTR